MVLASTHRILGLRVLIGLIVLFGAATKGQSPASNISDVMAAGRVKDDVYSNKYFGITITAPKAQFTVPSLVNVAGHRARLLNAVYDSPDGAKNYTFGLMADSLENYPKGMSTSVYVRSVRHQLERDGLQTEREEFPVDISGMAFVGAVLRVPERPNFGYRRGIYSTFLKGYVVSLEIQARDEERIRQVLWFAVKIAPSR